MLTSWFLRFLGARGICANGTGKSIYCPRKELSAVQYTLQRSVQASGQLIAFKNILLLPTDTLSYLRILSLNPYLDPFNVDRS